MARRGQIFNVLPILLIAGAVGGTPQQQQQVRPNVDLGLMGQFVFRVSRVEPGSPAEAAGITPGDIVRRIGRRLIHSTEDLKQVGISHVPGETVEIGYERFEAEIPSKQPAFRRATIQLRALTR
ncbi:MAG: PDZ domain-containing protein [Blastocatellia bacterium]